MRVYEFIDSLLKREGITDLFGVPGSYIMPIWQHMSGRIHLCTNEGDAAYIATGYGKSSGKISIVLTTASPGVTNAVSGIASAYRDSIALIVISGRQTANHTETGAFQEESSYNRAFKSGDLLQSITKETYYDIFDANDAARSFAMAVKKAKESRCGSVHISIPVDIQSEEIDDEVAKCAFKICDNTSDKYQKPSVSISNSINWERPLIIVGWGTYLSKSETAVKAFAHTIHAPIITTMKGSSCIDYDDPYYLGDLGFGYSKDIHNYLEKYDPTSVFVFGSSLGKKDVSEGLYKILKNTNVYMFINDDQKKNDYLSNFNIFCLGIDKAIQILRESLNDQCFKDDLGLQREIKQIKELTYNYYSSIIDSEHDLMAASIRDVYLYKAKEHVVLADAGNHYLDSIVLKKNCDMGCFFIDAGLGAMGNGICTAIGMAFADNKKKYICITGDGCALMNGNSIYLAARVNLPIVFIVYNNCSLGRVREGQRTMNGFISSDLGGVDFSKWAEALGIQLSRRVCDLNTFEDVFKEFLDAEKTSLIEVITDKDEIPLSLRKRKS